jgi:hypothetical protein
MYSEAFPFPDRRLTCVRIPIGQATLIHPVAVQLGGSVGVGRWLQLAEACLRIVLRGAADVVVIEQQWQRIQAEHHPEELVDALHQDVLPHAAGDERLVAAVGHFTQELRVGVFSCQGQGTHTTRSEGRRPEKDDTGL